jgi:hypothetical protein
MATEIQYQAFRAEYDEESRRASGLENRAKLYLTIITAYLGVIGFKIEDLLKFLDKFNVPVTLYLVMAVVLVGALLCTVWAMGIRTYEGLFDPKKEIESFGKKAPTDDEFRDKRLADLAVATNRNSKQNGRVATALQCAGILILLAISIQMAVFVVAIKNVRSMPNDQDSRRQQSGQAEEKK